jgi:vacuolar-type H+-ATPase subunit F/Vma7
MPAATPDAGDRIVVMGSAALTDGFRLLGLEVHPDADVAQLEALIRDLQRSRSNALLYLEQELARQARAPLARLRAEGGRIVVAEVPPLPLPADFTFSTEASVASRLGESA